MAASALRTSLPARSIYSIPGPPHHESAWLDRHFLPSRSRPHLCRRLPAPHSRHLHLQRTTPASTQRFSLSFHRPRFALGKSHRLAIRQTPGRTSPLASLRRNHGQIQQRHPHRPRQSRRHLRPPSQRQTVQRAANPNRATLRNAPVFDRCSAES